MAQFNNIYDFKGVYVGSYDGRQGEVSIMVNDDHSIFTIFQDKDRNSFYMGTQGPVAENSHVLRDITFTAPSREDVHWSRLHLHTWDTKYLSGVSTWHGQEYGMSFSRSEKSTSQWVKEHQAALVGIFGAIALEWVKM